jgi:cysteine desulfurase
MDSIEISPVLNQACAVRTVYFDYNATTPLDPAVREAMLPYLGEVFGNPSSIHHVGRKARAALDEARENLAALLRAKPSEIHFTSGGTESNNMAIFGVARSLRSKGRHLITSRVEHHSVLHCFQYLERKEGFEVTYLPVDSHGQVHPGDLAKAITPHTILVSIMAANNEVGSIQPVAELGAICRNSKVFFHTDAAQWFGKVPVSSIHDFAADLVTICAHKFHGPKGAGALFIKSPLSPDPILFGGGHENERRAGTENTAAVAGLAKAAELMVRTPVFDEEKLRPLCERLAGAASEIEGVELRGNREQGLCNTVSFTVDGCDSIGLMAGLDLEGICASSGSACSAGSLEPSHVLTAMGAPPRLANSFVRFSLGRENTGEEVEFVIEKLPRVIALQRG